MITHLTADVTSIKLSMLNPTREMLPASAPATSLKPFEGFQPMVKYSSLLPCSAIAERSQTPALIL